MMALDLAEYPPQQVLAALGKCRRELSRFPTIAEVISRIPGQAIDDASQATLIAGRITEAITKFGPYRTSEARTFIGDLGWQVVKESGDWLNLCEMGSRELAMSRSQWIKLAEAKLKSGLAPSTAARLEHAPPAITAMLERLPKMPEET